MHKSVLAPDRVLLLLSLVPYLREHGPTPVTELAETFGVSPALLRGLVRFLGTAGVPGETLSYQHEDLFDIDWTALEEEDLVSLTRTVAVDDAPRFSPAEAAALVAGLQALTAVLPPADAELARSTAAKLGEALGVSERGAAVTVTADPRDPRLPAIVAAIDAGRAVAFEYRDATGAESSRTVDPAALTQAAGAWYLRGYCRERRADRTFRVDQISALRVLDAEDAGDAGDAEAGADAVVAAAGGREEPRGSGRHPGGRPENAGAMSLVARLPARLLPRVRGFDPEVLEEDPAGIVRVRVEAWHGHTAIRLVQLAPGEIVVESPGAARDAVREWAERALSAYDA